MSVSVTNNLTNIIATTVTIAKAKNIIITSILSTLIAEEIAVASDIKFNQLSINPSTITIVMTINTTIVYNCIYYSGYRNYTYGNGY